MAIVEPVEPTPTRTKWFIIVVVVVVTSSISAYVYVWKASFLEQGESSPMISLKSTRNDDGSYTVIFTNVYKEFSLNPWFYFLKAETGLTKEFGKIALQNISGYWHGIDVTWDDNGTLDMIPGNHLADRNYSAGGPYSDPFQAQIRLDAVIQGFQSEKKHQKGEGVISVSFYDDDYDGNLSVGDYLMVFGNGYPTADYLADDCWRLEIKYGIVDDTIGSWRLGECV